MISFSNTSRDEKVFHAKNNEKYVFGQIFNRILPNGKGGYPSNLFLLFCNNKSEQILIECGGNLNHRNGLGNTALSLAKM